jgi:glutamate N-acetyltransferase/amino-acid N-acetyltransferase
MISWIAKGSGMIAPNMATMLCYIFTDAQLTASILDVLLRDAVKDTFGMLSVDTDTSTSDTCVLMANGLAGAVDQAAFKAVLRFGSKLMTELLARDGEGATRLLRVQVTDALNDDEARQIARTVNDSPLIKTMVFGADPNVGRILMAVGKCFDCTVKPESTHAWINGHHVVGEGQRLSFDDEVVRNALTTNAVDLRISLGVGVASATAYGCDLTQGYVEENAAYYSS